jgi:hypothetical protein
VEEKNGACKIEILTLSKLKDWNTLKPKAGINSGSWRREFG